MSVREKWGNTCQIQILLCTVEADCCKVLTTAVCFYVFDQAWMRVWSFTVRPGTHEASLCHAQARCTLKVRHITHTNTSEIYIAEKRCWYLRLTPKTNTSLPKNYCITKITKVCMVKMEFVDHLFTHVMLHTVRPESPQGIRVHQASDSNVTLTWSPGFTGHSRLSSCTIQVEYFCPLHGVVEFLNDWPCVHISLMVLDI